jgi:uncharacterized protein YhfF
MHAGQALNARQAWGWNCAVEYANIAAMWQRADGLRAFGFGDAGPMRQRLTALTVAGTKVATGDLWQQGYVDEGEAVEEIGERLAVLDDDDRVVAIIEITLVEKHRFAELPWEFACAEGEGFASIEHWREGHRSYYAKHGVDVDDTSIFVCLWFRLDEIRLARASED